MSAKNHLQRDFIVVLHSGSEKDVDQALQKLGSMTARDLTPFAVIDCAANSGYWVDPVATVFQNSHATRTNLIDWLAVNMGQIESVRLLGVVGSEHDSSIFELIDTSMRNLVDVFLRMSVNLNVKEFRVAIPTYSSEIPKEPFFSEGAHANLVVVARDSLSHRSIKRPIENESGEDYANHIAIEISTLFGMWKEMPSPIVDELKTVQTGVPEILVRFASSHMRLLDCPALPIDRLMSQEGELPLPYQFFRVPDANQAAEKYSNLIFPNELRFTATEPPLGPLVSVNGRKFKRQYFGELFKAFAQTPAALLRGVQDHLGAMSGAALQEAVGGAKSSVEVMYPGRNVDTGDVSITHDQIDRIIAAVADRADRPVISTIGDQAWVQIVEKVLAVADGGSAAEEERSTFSDEKFLLVRQSALSPEVEDLNSLLRELYEGKSSDLQLDKEMPEADDFASTISADEEPIIESMISEEVDDLSTPDHEEIQEVANEQIERVDILEELTLDSPVEEVIENKPENVRPDLLGKITQIMLSEGASARERAEQMVGYLRELPGKFAASEVSTISNSVKFAVALGLSVIYFAVGALTSRRNWFNFEFLGDRNKSLAWVLITTILGFAAVSGIVIRNNEKWQGKVIGAATALVVLLGLEFVFWNSIWTLVMKVQRFRGGPLAATLLLIAALVVVAISITRNRLSDSKVRKQFAGALLVFSWVYVVIGATAAMGSDRSAIWSKGKIAGEVWTESRISGLRNVSLAAGLTMLIVSGFVVAFTIVRERYKLEELSRYFIWAVDELETSTDAERRLRLAASQWVGTASVLSRLIRYPLGRGILAPADTAINSGASLSVLKFDHQNLVLTKRGEQGLTARLRQLFIAKGWLGRQYRQLIIKFQEDMAFEQGVSQEETKGMRPESCPAVPTFEEIVNGDARGSRWTFMNSVFNDQYDSVLLETTNEVQLEAAYSTIVDNADSHSVGGSALVAPDYFDLLIPIEPVRLPNGLVTSLFAANDNRQLMKPYVWWPEELLPKPKTQQMVKFRSSSVLTPEKLTDPIRLLGSCVLLSEAFVLTEVGMGEGLFNQINESTSDEKIVVEPPPRRDV